jgi:hypothetical protein
MQEQYGDLVPALSDASKHVAELKAYLQVQAMYACSDCPVPLRHVAFVGSVCGA